MPKMPEYNPITADGIDTDDLVVMDVDGVTKKVPKSELKKSIDRVITGTPSGAITLALTDEGKYLRVDGDVNIPLNATVAWPVSAGVTIRNTTADDITILPAIGVSYSGSTTIPPGGTAVLIKIAPDTWDIIGGPSAGADDRTDPSDFFDI